MSNRRRPTAGAIATSIARYIQQHHDGCDQCDAEVELRRHPAGPSLLVLTIHHDAGCPTLLHGGTHMARRS